jgi:hypothetical protein
MKGRIRGGVAVAAAALAMAIPAYGWSGDHGRNHAGARDENSQGQHTNRGRHCGWYKKARHHGSNSWGRGCPRFQQSGSNVSGSNTSGSNTQGDDESGSNDDQSGSNAQGDDDGGRDDNGDRGDD